MIDPVSSNSSNEEGNTITPRLGTTKQISPAKRWCFTLNNYTESEISSIVPIFNEYCSLGGFSKEVGDSGTPHLQGYVEFITKRRPKAILPIPRIHWEKAKGSKKDNLTYIQKDEVLSWSKGLPKVPTTINEKDFYAWQKELVSIFKTPCKWDCRTIYWRYGGIFTGKTQFAKWCVAHLGAVIIGGGAARHILAQVQNQPADMYIILLSYGDEKVSYRAIEQIKDGLFTTSFGCDNNKMEIRDAPHILIIGNEPPDTTDRNYHPTKYNVAEIGNQ